MNLMISPLIVLIHGLGFWGYPYRAMNNVRMYLNDNGYAARVVRLPGFSGSPYRAQFLSDQLREIVDEEGVIETPLYLICHSQGGLTAMWMLLDGDEFILRHVSGMSAIATPWQGADFADAYANLLYRPSSFNVNDGQDSQRQWFLRWQRMIDWYGTHILRMDRHPLDSVALIQELSGEYREARGLIAPWEQYNQIRHDQTQRTQHEAGIDTMLPPVETYSAIVGRDTSISIETGLLSGLDLVAKSYRWLSGREQMRGDRIVTEQSARGPGVYQRTIEGDHFSTSGHIGYWDHRSKDPLRVYLDIANRVNARRLD